MKTLLDSSKVKDAIDNLASQIINDQPAQDEFYVVGIRSRGSVLGKRLAAILGKKCQKEILGGTLDIALYRDDFDDPHGGTLRPVGVTELPGDINDKIIILVDDVLHTGRSTRAALDAIVAFGRPAKIRLAVLVDRGNREFPIQADYVGAVAQVDNNEIVQVSFEEIDGSDVVEVVSIEK